MASSSNAYAELTGGDRLPDGYRRHQLLLRREDGTPAGFVRIEQDGSRCSVEVKADGVSGEAKALLLSPEGREIRQIGMLVKGKAVCTLRSEDIQGFWQAAVMAGDKLLLIGGEGADFRPIRKLLNGQMHRGRPSAHAARIPKDKEPDREVGAAQEENQKALMGNAQGEHPQIAQPPCMEEAFPLEPAEEDAAREEWEEAASVNGEDVPLEVDAPEWEPPQEGWVIMPYPAGNAPERIVGHFYQAGRVQSLLQGVAGAYAPEPPPGLTGYVWDGGFWVRIEAVEDELA